MELHNYEFRKIDAFSQLHVVRKLAPVVGELVSVISNAKDLIKPKEGKELSIDDVDFNALAKDIGPLLELLAKLPDDHIEFATKTLLKGVYLKQGGLHAPVINSQGGIMFDSIKDDLQLMLTLAAKSLMVNLSGFISALPSGLKDGALQKQTLNG